MGARPGGARSCRRCASWDRLHPYSPLGRGFLAGTITRPGDLDASDVAPQRFPRFSGRRTSRGTATLVGRLEAIAERRAHDVRAARAGLGAAKGEDLTSRSPGRSARWHRSRRTRPPPRPPLARRGGGARGSPPSGGGGRRALSRGRPEASIAEGSPVSRRSPALSVPPLDPGSGVEARHDRLGRRALRRQVPGADLGEPAAVAEAAALEDAGSPAPSRRSRSGPRGASARAPGRRPDGSRSRRGAVKRSAPSRRWRTLTCRDAPGVRVALEHRHGLDLAEVPGDPRAAERPSAARCVTSGSGMSVFQRPCEDGERRGRPRPARRRRRRPPAWRPRSESCRLARGRPSLTRSKDSVSPPELGVEQRQHGEAVSTRAPRRASRRSSSPRSRGSRSSRGRPCRRRSASGAARARPRAPSSAPRRSCARRSPGPRERARGPLRVHLGADDAGDVVLHAHALDDLELRARDGLTTRSPVERQARGSPKIGSASSAKIGRRRRSRARPSP